MKLFSVCLLLFLSSVPLTGFGIGADRAVDMNAASPDSLTTTNVHGMNTTTIAPMQFANWAAWNGYISQIPSPQAGCFEATYPSTVWQPTQCGTAPLLPLLPSLPSTVGNGNDKVAHSPSSLIGSSFGSFQSISGLTSETDTGGSLGGLGANEFGLQDNTNFFTTSTTYTDSKSTTGWEQFVFANDPSGVYETQIYIQYWLINYHTTYGSCPSTIPQGGNGWYVYSGDCWANSPSTFVPSQTASNLANLILRGYADFAGSNDEVAFCISGGSCYSVAITDQVVNLYQHWTDAEFNVFGFCCSSQANFNSGTSITVLNTLKDQNGNVIVPSCMNTGFTAETNNLNLGSCSSNGNGQIVFTEIKPPLVTSVSLIGPANNTALTATYLSLSVKVVTAPATVEKDVQVKLKVNNTQICPIGNATSAGAFSCAYSVETSGLYQWNASAEGEVAGSNMTGTLISETFTFTAGPYVQKIALVQGWNLISMPVVPANTAISKVLASQIAGGNFSIIWSYQTGAWKSATLNNMHVLSGSLTTMQDGLGYWVYMTKADTLYVTGFVFAPAVSPPTYNLVAGWNLVGYKPQPNPILNENVAIYLSSITSSYDPNNVWVYNNSNGSWIRTNPTTHLTPGEGMWILMTAPATLKP